MPKLKFKNGSTWTELSVGGGSLDDYPIGSCYYGVVGIYGTSSGNDTSNRDMTAYSYDLSQDKSPALKFGGVWQEIIIPTSKEDLFIGYCMSPSNYSFAILGSDSSGNYPCYFYYINKRTNSKNLQNEIFMLITGISDVYDNNMYKVDNPREPWSSLTWAHKPSSSKALIPTFVCRIWQRIA